MLDKAGSEQKSISEKADDYHLDVLHAANCVSIEVCNWVQKILQYIERKYV